MFCQNLWRIGRKRSRTIANLKGLWAYGPMVASMAPWKAALAFAHRSAEGRISFVLNSHRE